LRKGGSLDMVPPCASSTAAGPEVSHFAKPPCRLNGYSGELVFIGIVGHSNQKVF